MTKKNKFEASLSELQSIIHELESETHSIDDMIKLFEKGMSLMSFCENELNLVEERVKTLIQNSDGFKEEIGIKKK